MQKYSIRKKKSTGEFHIHLAKSFENQCKVEIKSLCNKSTFEESESKTSCESEDEVRMSAARIGRDMCGTCVSFMYETK